MSSACPPSVLCVRPVDVRAVSQDSEGLGFGVGSRRGGARRRAGSVGGVRCDRAGDRVGEAVDGPPRRTGPYLAEARVPKCGRTDRGPVGHLDVDREGQCWQTSKQLADLPTTAEVMRSGELSAAKADAIVGGGRGGAGGRSRACWRSRCGTAREAPGGVPQGPGRDGSGRRARADPPRTVIAGVHRRRRRLEPPRPRHRRRRRPVPDRARSRSIDAQFKASQGRRPPRAASRRTRSTRSSSWPAAPTAPDAEPREAEAARRRSTWRSSASTTPPCARGSVEGDEVCEIAGLGPIPVRVARELLGDAILKLVITKGVDVAERHPPRTVRHRRPTGRAVVAVTRVHRAMGCTRTYRLENDHRDDWAQDPPHPPRRARPALRATTTTSRPTTAGHSSTAPANDPWSHPTTPATPADRGRVCGSDRERSTNRRDRTRRGDAFRAWRSR